MMKARSVPFGCLAYQMGLFRFGWAKLQTVGHLSKSCKRTVLIRNTAWMINLGATSSQDAWKSAWLSAVAARARRPGAAADVELEEAKTFVLFFPSSSLYRIQQRKCIFTALED